jgi:metallophosphoesterase superfamily enzyme
VRSTVELAPGLFAHGSGALWVERDKALLAADAHLGYAWAQRRRGELGPLVEGDARARLEAAVEELAPEVVVFLGDLVHAPRPAPEEKIEIEATLGALARRARLVAVRGNHDRNLERDFAIEAVDQWSGAEIVAVHGDRPVEAEGRLVALGHLHPSIRWHDAAGVATAFPVFVQSARAVVLPAFTPFSLGYAISGRLPAEWEALLGPGPYKVVAVNGRWATPVR